MSKKPFDPKKLEALPNPQIPYDFAYLLKVGLHNAILEWLEENAPEDLAELFILSGMLEVYTENITTNKDGKASPAINRDITGVIGDILRLAEKLDIDFQGILGG